MKPELGKLNKMKVDRWTRMVCIELDYVITYYNLIMNNMNWTIVKRPSWLTGVVLKRRCEDRL